jgi:hypothetical protein
MPGYSIAQKKNLANFARLISYGAGDGTRTRNLLITNQLLCRLSYASIMATQKGFEPSTSGVTGRRSEPAELLGQDLVTPSGFEPLLPP